MDDFGPEFVGRDGFLEEIERAWTRFRLFQVVGLRSVGKSRTVQEFIKRKTREINETIADSGNTSGTEEPSLVKVVVIDMRLVSSEEVLHSSLCSCLGVVPQWSGDQLPKNWIPQLLHLVESRTERVILFVFDNAEDAIETCINDAFLSFCQIMIRHCKRVRIFITSTTRLQFAQMSRICFSTELLPLSEPESCTLLKQVAADVDFGCHLEKLASLCSGLPLALMLAASALRADGGLLTPEEMVEMLVESRVEALSGDCYPEQDRLGIVYKKFIQRLSQLFQERLAILGYIPGSFSVTEAQEMLGHQTSAKAKQESLLPLRQRSMLQLSITPSEMQRRFDLHGILRDCLDVYFTIKNLPEIRARFCRAFTAVMTRISEQMSTEEYAQATVEFSLEHPNFRQLLTEVYYCSEDTYRYFIRVAGSCTNLIEKFMASKGETFYTACLSLARTVRQEQDMATVYIALGSLFTNTKGKFLLAEENFHNAKRILEQGEASERLARLYYSMGYNLYIQGRGASALRYVKRALEMCVRLGLHETEFYLSALAYLGVVHTFLGNYIDGEKCHMLNLQRRIKLQGECHPSVGAAYNNLGVLYDQQKMFDKAIYYFQKGLDVKKASNASYWSVIFSLSNVALQHANLGEFDKAKELLSEARTLLTAREETNLATTALICNSFGKVYLKEGDFERAVEELSEATRIRELNMATGPFLVNTLLLLSRGHIGAGQPLDALTRLEQALGQQRDLTEHLPHNDLVHQCHVALLQVYSVTCQADKVEETLDAAEDELRRLIYVFKVVRSDDKKYQEFKDKLELVQTRNVEDILRQLT